MSSFKKTTAVGVFPVCLWVKFRQKEAYLRWRSLKQGNGCSAMSSVTAIYWVFFEPCVHPTRLVFFQILCITIFTVTPSLGQHNETINYKNYYEYDQVYGLHKEKGNYTLVVAYGDDTLKWQADKKFPANTCTIQKITDKYIVALSEDGTKVFYSRSDKRLFYMTRWETSLTAYGFGLGSLGIRESVSQMIRLINQDKSEEEVIAFLSRQAEYDF